jgi:aminopeptidase N
VLNTSSVTLRASALAFVWVFLAACDDDAAPASVTPDPTEGEKEDSAKIAANWKSKIDHTWLHVDLADRTAEASIWFEPGRSSTVSLEAAGLTIDAVTSDTGPVAWEKRAGALHIAHDVGKGPIHIDYRFPVEPQGEGLAGNGSTVLWPYYCGNLFPCRSGPADGMRFVMEVSGTKSDERAIYPEELPADAPSYTLAFAVGRYTCQVLGKTPAATEVSVCWLPRGKTKALTGTKSLVKAFAWLESHIGPYTFGKKVASIAVAWGESAAGGMEHHPYWHIATSEMELPLTHVHEAVHGWFGTGVRMRCWEDFVLSEGTTSYLSARALAQVTDARTENAIWDEYEETLEATLEDEDILAWPTTCGKVDILDDGLFSNIVYMKGAFFWRDVAKAIGPEVLDEVFSGFYRARVGTAAGMQDLLDEVRIETGFDPAPLVQKWLRSRGNPLR